MSKTIKIPEDYKPNYICEINGVKYSYPAGQTVEVPDDVAEVIENDLALNPTPAPTVAQSDLFIRNAVEWDFNTDGLVSVPFWTGNYYKISSVALSDSEILQGVIYTIKEMGIEASNPSYFNKHSDGFWELDMDSSVLIVQRDNMIFNGFGGDAFFQEKGIYYQVDAAGSDRLIEKIQISFNGYNGFPPIPRIDPKYLPQSTGGGEVVPVFAGLEGDEVYIFKDIEYTEKVSAIEAFSWLYTGTKMLVADDTGASMSEAFCVNLMDANLCYFGKKPGSNESTVVIAKLLPFEG